MLYVAMTRARDQLVPLQPLRFFIRGQARGADGRVFAPRGRFIADDDLGAFELVGSLSPGRREQVPRALTHRSALI